MNKHNEPSTSKRSKSRSEDVEGRVEVSEGEREMLHHGTAKENQSNESETWHGRPNDNGRGRPVRAPKNLKTVISEPHEEPESESNAHAEEIIRRKEIKMPNLLRIPIIYFGILTISSMIGIWLLASVVELAGNLAVLPLWVAYICFAILISLSGIILYLLGSLIFRYTRLQRSPQLVWEQINRAEMKETGAYEQAQKWLWEYLSEIDKEKGRYINNLSQLGFSNQDCQQFKASLEQLLEDKPIDSYSWIMEYRNNIQEPLDRLAKERRKYYATIVGFKTAIAPWKAVDIIAVIYNNTLLIKELCTLANVRASGIQSLFIMAHLGFNTFVGSKAQSVAEDSVERAFEADGWRGGDELSKIESGSGEDIMRDEGVMQIADSIGGDAFKSVFKKVLAKGGEGVANAFLTRRLGAYAWKMITPLAK